jgi:hypothetical protein
MTTQPARNNVTLLNGLPRMFRRRPQVPDGRAEIIALDIVYEALMPLPAEAQNRVIEHVVKLLNERARALSDYQFEE